MKKVAMIGVGKLGQDCAEVMAEHYDVIGYDVEPRNPSFPMKESIRDAVYDRDIIFVAAPTPHDPKYGGETPTSHLPNKDFDYSIVTEILSEVDKHTHSGQLVVLISTVLPGTTRSILRPCITKARFVYNPYLIAMGTIKYDMVNPEMVIIGTEDGSLTGDAQELIDFYKPMMENDPRYEVGTWDEAESIKIFYNTFISTKLALVNMIQDVAEKSGNINVDVVTKALAKSTERIMGPRYMTAGLGDAGACHPRDNIALRWLAEKLNLGYDLFDSIMKAREIQAENMALTCLKNGKNVTIIGKAYKPKVSYTHGSASMLVGHYIEKHGGNVNYYDEHTGDLDLRKEWTDVYLIGYWDDYVERIEWPIEATVIDPWRKIQHPKHSGTIIHYGDTRQKKKFSIEEIDDYSIDDHFFQFLDLIPQLKDFSDRVHIVYAGIHSDYPFNRRSVEHIIADIDQGLKEGKTKIIFDGNAEDFLPKVIVKIHKIIKLMEDRLSPKNVFYSTGADNTEEAYDYLFKKYKWDEKINIINFKYFQYSFIKRVRHIENLPVYQIRQKDKNFLCFNKVARYHRCLLLEKLLELDLVRDSYYSFEGDSMGALCPETFPNLLKLQPTLPHSMRLNITKDRNNPTDFIEEDLKYFDNSYFSVVTETCFDSPPGQNAVFLSEKIYKCFVAKHPFIVLGKPGTLKTLRDHGFLTFNHIIDESYDNIFTDTERMDAIVKEIQRLCNQTPEEWLQFQEKCKNIVEFNHRKIFSIKQDFVNNKDVLTELFRENNLPMKKDYTLEDPVIYEKNDTSVKLVPIKDPPEHGLDIAEVTLKSKIKIKYPRYLDGGGLHFVDDLVNVISHKNNGRIYQNALEWCSGFGVLGFETLGLGLCKKITFTDYFEPAIKTCLENAVTNGLENYVKGYVTPVLSTLPDNEKFDLVIANPPHIGSYQEFKTSFMKENSDVNAFYNSARLCVDEDWSIHKEFFKNVRKYTELTADIFLIENNDHNILKNLAKLHGLYFIESIPMKDDSGTMRKGTIMHFKLVHDYK